MRTPVIIRTPFLSAEQVAEHIGVPAYRVKQLKRLADSILAGSANGKSTKKGAAIKKRAAKTSRIRKK